MNFLSTHSEMWKLRKRPLKMYENNGYCLKFSAKFAKILSFSHWNFSFNFLWHVYNITSINNMQKTHFPEKSPSLWILPVSPFISLPKHPWFCHGTSHIMMYMIFIYVIANSLLQSANLYTCSSNTFWHLMFNNELQIIHVHFISFFEVGMLSN